MAVDTAFESLRAENRTLYSVVRLVASSLDLRRMLQGIVDIATDATGCHACFIYLVEERRLVMRAASPVFANAVGEVQLDLEEGLAGWVARHQKPEFIREGAMGDPRMKYFPILQEERFQSMIAVPILARAGATIGVIVLHTEAPREFTEETLNRLVHIASLVSGALENAQLYTQARERVEALTRLAGLKDLFDALAAGDTDFAAAKAAEVHCDLRGPFLMLCAEPAGDREQASRAWRAAAEQVGARLRALVPGAAVEDGPGPVRAALPLGRPGDGRLEDVMRTCRALGREAGAAIGVSGLGRASADATRAFREAVDATTIGRALLPDGGAIAYSELGAYRYLVHIADDDAPRDRVREAIDLVIDYDRRRKTALLDTLERYLTERRSIVDSARALYIHPNTLRQRLARITELTGIDLDRDDLLSLELAIKLARLHGRPLAGDQSASVTR